MDNLTEQNQKFVAEIVPGLYLGSWLATKPVILDTLQIETVISIGSDLYSDYKKGIQYHRYDFDDNSQSTSEFVKAIDQVVPLIHDEITQNRIVLIHCSAGKSRSVSLTIAYLMKHHQMSVTQALEHIESKRKCINPNESFLRALEGI